MFQRFGLTNAFIAVTQHILDLRIDAFEDVPILGLPPQAVVPHLELTLIVWVGFEPTTTRL